MNKKSMSGLVELMKKISLLGVFRGNDNPILMNMSRKYHKKTSSLLIYTRDEGMHSCGWFKNPDYERCFHLSISYQAEDNGKIYLLSQNRNISELWCRLFFGDNVSKLWIEPSFSLEGKQKDVYHYRLFCDKNWQPIIPRKEVYSKDFTEKNWKSWSEIHR